MDWLRNSSVNNSISLSRLFSPHYLSRHRDLEVAGQSSDRCAVKKNPTAYSLVLMVWMRMLVICSHQMY